MASAPLPRPARVRFSRKRRRKARTTMDGGMEASNRCALHFASRLCRFGGYARALSISRIPRRRAGSQIFGAAGIDAVLFPVLISSVALPGERPRLDESLDLSGRLLCDQQGLSHLSAALHRRHLLLAVEPSVLSRVDDPCASARPVGDPRQGTERVVDDPGRAHLLCLPA